MDNRPYQREVIFSYWFRNVLLLNSVIILVLDLFGLIVLDKAFFAMLISTTALAQSIHNYILNKSLIAELNIIIEGIQEP
jgi:hypothetical protein